MRAVRGRFRARQRLAQLPNPSARSNAVWKHARWISASDLIDGPIARAVQQFDSYMIDDANWTADDRARRLLPETVPSSR